MKKLTAGILTVMLGIVSANSADAAVASKGYVDAVVKTNADAITNLTSTVNQHTTDIAGKVAQSDYDTKIGQLEDADTSMADLVGTLPEGATASTIVGYIQEKTSGIATEGTVSELSNRVTQAETDIEALESKVGNETVANQIAGAITALDLANTYETKGAAAQALADAKADTDSKIQDLALQAISKVPAECSNMTKYCVLTYGTNGFVWEVIERADGETGGSSADTTQQ